MPRSKYSPEFRAMVSQEYIDGEGSVHFLANKYGIGYTTLRGWINEYRIHGISAFCHKTNRTYSKEFKIKCGEAGLMDKRGHHKTDGEADCTITFLSDNDCDPPIRISLFHFFWHSLHSLL